MRETQNNCASVFIASPNKTLMQIASLTRGSMAPILDALPSEIMTSEKKTKPNRQTYVPWNRHFSYLGDPPEKERITQKERIGPFFFDSTHAKITQYYPPNNKPKRLPKVEVTVKSGNWRLPPRSAPPPPRANDEEATPEGADAAFYSKLSCDQNAMHGRLPRGWAGARRRVPVTRLEESPSRHLPLQLNLQRAGHPAASANRSHLAASARSPCKRFWIEAVKEVSLKSVCR